MTLLALGINHRTATVAVRERVAFTPAQLESALAELRSLPHISEAAVLSTCNRTELYCVTDAAGEQIVLDWLGRFHNLRVEELARCAYHYHDNDYNHHRKDHNFNYNLYPQLCASFSYRDFAQGRSLPDCY